MRKVWRKYGNLRKLSDEVETLLGSSLVVDMIISGFEKLGIEVKGAISSREVKERRYAKRAAFREDLRRNEEEKSC